MIIFKFKILLLGPAAVGKTSVLHRFVSNDFKKDYASTIGVKFLTKELKLHLDKASDDEAQLSLWDVGGQPRFLDLRTTFYRGANGALLVFDLTRENTLEELEVWHAEMTKVLAKEIPFALIGNKLDLTKKKDLKIISNKAKKFAKSKNSIYIETSAKTGKNVEKAFLELTLLTAVREGGITMPKTTAKKAPKKKGRVTYFVKSKVREYIKSKGCNVSKDLINGNALNKIITEILDKAIANAKAEGRKTVQPNDIT